MLSYDVTQLWLALSPCSLILNHTISANYNQDPCTSLPGGLTSPVQTLLFVVFTIYSWLSCKYWCLRWSTYPSKMGYFKWSPEPSCFLSHSGYSFEKHFGPQSSLSRPIYHLSLYQAFPVLSLT